MSDITKVLPAVVLPITINVVDVMGGPLTDLHRPDYAMCGEPDVENRPTEISVISNVCESLLPGVSAVPNATKQICGALPPFKHFR